MSPVIKKKIRKYSFAKRNNEHSPQEFDTASITKLKSIAVCSNGKSLTLLETHINGLSDDEVEDRLHLFGLNEVVHEKAPKWYIQFLQAFLNPFIAVLFILSIISLITDVNYTITRRQGFYNCTGYRYHGDAKRHAAVYTRV